jgi:DNA-directed RNA polymerase beta subunit
MNMKADIERLLEGVRQPASTLVQDQYLKLVEAYADSDNNSIQVLRLYDAFLKQIPDLVADQPPLILDVPLGCLICYIGDVELSPPRTAASSKSEAFTAVKLSAFGDTAMLERPLYSSNIHTSKPRPLTPRQRAMQRIALARIQHNALLLPSVAERFGLTYNLVLHCTLHWAVYGQSDRRIVSHGFRRVALGGLPLMVGSLLCPTRGIASAALYQLGCGDDVPGGYFVIKGRRKCVIASEKPLSNYPRVLFTSQRSSTVKGSQAADVQWDDSNAAKRGSRSNSVMVSCSSIPSFPFGIGTASALVITLEPVLKSAKVLMHDEVKTTGTGSVPHARYILRAQFHQVRTSIPLFGLFFALGCESIAEALRYIVYDPVVEYELYQALLPTVFDSVEAETDDQERVYSCLQQFINSKYGTSSAVLHERQRTQSYRYVTKLLHTHLLPHIATTCEGNKKKLVFMGHMVRQAILGCLNQRPMDIRDRLRCKTLHTIDRSFCHILQRSLADFKRHARMTMQRNQRKMGAAELIREAVAKAPHVAFTASGAYVMTSGNLPISAMVGGNHTFQFGTSNNKGGLTTSGTIQMLNTTNRLATFSHLSRITVTVDRSNVRNTKIRQLNTSQLHLFCLVESPEGGSCGILRNLAVCGTVSLPKASGYSILTEERLVDTLLDGDGPSLFRQYDDGPDQTTAPIASEAEILLTVDHRPVGWIADAGLSAVWERMRAARRCGRLGRDVSFHLLVRRDAVHVVTGGGRLLAPFLVLDGAGRPLLSPSEAGLLLKGDDDNDATIAALLRTGKIELLDDGESVNCVIALHFESLATSPSPSVYTHASIHPATLLSLCSLHGGFQTHTQAPRNVVHCGMLKQAIGPPRTIGLDPTGSYELYQAQTALVPNYAMTSLRMAEHPIYQTCMVAITNHGLHNVNDAYTASSAAIQRGMFRSLFTFKRRIEIPVQQVPTAAAASASPSAYPPGVRVGVNDCVNNQTVLFLLSPLHELKVGHQHNTSSRVIAIDAFWTPWNHLDPLALEMEVDNEPRDRNGLWNAGASGPSLVVEFTLVQENEAQTGDKIVIGQSTAAKGVLAPLVSQSDMPFTEDGMVPDVILNPHSVFGRLTIGLLFEMLCGKARLGDRRRFRSGDDPPAGWTSTVGCHEDVAGWMDALVADGQSPFALETFTDGVTGMPLVNPIAFGPISVSTLTHLVSKKIYGRGLKGPMNSFYHAPCEGRKADGGLRLGEQETALLIRHGMGAILHSFLPCQSDAHETLVCGRCGVLGYGICSPGNDITVADEAASLVCPTGCSPDKIRKVRLPFSSILLIHELRSMGVACALRLSPEVA